MDHRGFAASPGILEQSEFELALIIDDIESLRQHLKLDNIIIIGHSGHAYMALEYAKKYPEHVSHVVMLGASPDLSNENQQAAEAQSAKIYLYFFTLTVKICL